MEYTCLDYKCCIREEAEVSWLESGLLGIYTAVLIYLLLKEDLLVIFWIYTAPKWWRKLLSAFLFFYS